jgi:glutaminyl-tRNA synthetase
MSENIINESAPLDFIREMIAEDVKNGKHGGEVITRFPPEPNGYLHIGHAKAFCLDFGVAVENGGRCHLRMDDTNPTKEDMEYVEAIIKDIHWMGWDWGEHLYFASDYFEQFYDYAIELIEKGLAYVCDQTADEFKATRGTLTTPGSDSPNRNRSIEESLDLFKRMRDGEFDDGAKTLRAKIDMSHSNIHMRDPALYRIRRFNHFRQGDKWCIYPMYDYAHPLEDAIEGVTHSLCSLEFEIHRPLYDWVIDNVSIAARPEQTEFARLNLTYTVMSKRKLLDLVKGDYVKGWDDPRMPTLSGLRRRGYTPESIHNFCARIGMTKVNSLTDVALLEHCLREELNKTANRVMGVLDPLKMVIENFPEDETDWLDAINNPEDPDAGSRKVPFSRELYIDRADFMEDPPKKYFRLSLGREVRLRYGFFVTCTDVIKDEAGEVVELRCTYDPATRGGSSPDGRKVKGTIHWVSAREAIKADVRLYDRLFTVENPGADGIDYLTQLNEDSLEVKECYVEPSVAGAEAGALFQFERQGYFCIDADSTADHLVFNRAVALRDSWAKKHKK